MAVNLGSGTGTAGDANGDTLSGIENLTGSSFDDTLQGNSLVNLLDGGDGDDTLQGGAGADTITGGLRFRHSVLFASGNRSKRQSGDGYEFGR